MINSVGQNYAFQANYAKQNNVNFGALFSRNTVKIAPEPLATVADETIKTLTSENNSLKITLATLQKQAKKLTDKAQSLAQDLGYVQEHNGELIQKNQEQAEKIAKHIEEKAALKETHELAMAAKNQEFQHLKAMKPIEGVVTPEIFGESSGFLVANLKKAEEAIREVVKSGKDDEKLNFLTNYLSHLEVLEEGNIQNNTLKFPECFEYGETNSIRIFRNLIAKSLSEDSSIKNSKYREQAVENGANLLRHMNEMTKTKEWEEPMTFEQLINRFIDEQLKVKK